MTGRPPVWGLMLQGYAGDRGVLLRGKAYRLDPEFYELLKACTPPAVRAASREEIDRAKRRKKTSREAAAALPPRELRASKPDDDLDEVTGDDGGGEDEGDDPGPSVDPDADPEPADDSEAPPGAPGRGGKKNRVKRDWAQLPGA